MIHLTIHKKIAGLSGARIQRFAAAALRAVGENRADVSLLLTTDSHIRCLNRKYLRHDRATDVLAFAQEKKPRTKRVRYLLGDIMVSVERAKAYAKRHRLDWKEELELYIVHGILHLLGYDDHGAKDRARMRKKEADVLRKVRA